MVRNFCVNLLICKVTFFISNLDFVVTKKRVKNEDILNKVVNIYSLLSFTRS